MKINKVMEVYEMAVKFTRIIFGISFIKYNGNGISMNVLN